MHKPKNRFTIGDMIGPLHQYVLDNLQKSKGGWAAVADGSGVPLRTLEKVARQTTKYPRIDTVERLAQYFRQQEAA